jgi:hypothetical protein
VKSSQQRCSNKKSNNPQLSASVSPSILGPTPGHQRRFDADEFADLHGPLDVNREMGKPLLSFLAQ